MGTTVVLTIIDRCMLSNRCDGEICAISRSRRALSSRNADLEVSSSSSRWSSSTTAAATAGLDLPSSSSSSSSSFPLPTRGVAAAAVAMMYCTEITHEHHLD